ncbi:hypothetical protein BLNAU_9405 [Blattamonas nauphoetae]|uniref:RRM domain-containing protein n=1 Tax=Blattamonas nauphoetae TaxID=2049346 RepID=A0ABQ9XVN5_9EUKA|nr:hypothetical protein BLNAU_9405 [Blattamonas nauphoetae]
MILGQPSEPTDDNCICLKDIRPPLTLSDIRDFFLTSFPGKIKWGFWQKEPQPSLPQYGHVYFVDEQTVKSIVDHHHYLKIKNTYILVFPASKNKSIAIHEDPLTQYHDDENRQVLAYRLRDLKADYHYNHDDQRHITYLEFTSREDAVRAHELIRSSMFFDKPNRTRWLDSTDDFHHDLYLSFNCPRDVITFDTPEPTVEDMELIFDAFYEPFLTWYEQFSRKKFQQQKERNRPRLELHLANGNWLNGKAHVFFSETLTGEQEAKDCLDYFAKNQHLLTITIGPNSHPVAITLKANGHPKKDGKKDNKKFRGTVSPHPAITHIPQQTVSTTQFVYRTTNSGEGILPSPPPFHQSFPPTNMILPPFGNKPFGPLLNDKFSSFP